MFKSYIEVDMSYKYIDRHTKKNQSDAYTTNQMNQNKSSLCMLQSFKFN